VSGNQRKRGREGRGKVEERGGKARKRKKMGWGKDEER